MKVNRSYTLDFEVVEKLKKEDNASDLINNLLLKFFNISEKSEEQILKDVENKIKESSDNEKEAEEREKISNFTKNMTLEQAEEYLLGIKLGEWRSTIEYAKHKLQEGV